MKMLQRFLCTALLLVLVVGLAQAQAACPTIVIDALSALSRSCNRTGRNQACYGHATLTAQPQAGIADLRFAAPGHIENLDRIQAFSLNGMNEATAEWGVALIMLQASLPGTLPGQNVSLLLFGSTQLNRDDATAAANGYGNGIQAFTFASGIGDARCAEAPDSGVLIQTQRGKAEVVFTVNGVQIWLGSTVYLQSSPGGTLFIYLVEGSAKVAAFGVEQVMPAGTVVTVPLGGDSRAVAPPNPPQAYNPGIVQRLAPLLAQLPRRVVIAAPLDLSGCTLIAPANANTRQGPGTNFARGARLNANTPQAAASAAMDASGARWYQLLNGSWVREDVVNEYGPCHALAQVEIVPTISSSPVVDRLILEPASNTYTWVVNDCTGAPEPPRNGWLITVAIGLGDWPTPAERDAQVAGHSASITIDGVPLLIHYQDLLHNGEYGVNAAVYWTATPGTHTVVGVWQGPRHRNATTCTFTVEG